MATETIKSPSQAFPGAGSLVDLYTVPALTSAVGSSLECCNQSATPTTIRISIAVGGAADTQKQYLKFDLPLAGNDNFTETVGFTLAAGDIVRVQSASGTVSFNLFKTELS